MTQVSGDLTVNRCEHHAQPLFLICDWKHDEINPVRKVTHFKNVPMSAEWTVNYSRSFIVNITSRQLERENQSNTCHGTTLHPPFKTQCATNSCYGNNKHLMFLKWRPELKKKKKIIISYLSYLYNEVCSSLKKVLSDERLGAKLRVTENRCVTGSWSSSDYRALF